MTVLGTVVKSEIISLKGDLNSLRKEVNWNSDYRLFILMFIIYVRVLVNFIYIIIIKLLI